MGWGRPKRPITSNKTGAPSPREGSDGDIQIRQTNYGPKLFGKLGGAWLNTFLFIESDAFNIKNKNGAEVAKITSKGSLELQGNRVVTAGGITASADANMSIGHVNNLSNLVYHADNINNIAIGDNALYSAVNAAGNIAIGKEAMYYVARSSSDAAGASDENIAIGSEAMKGKAGGSRTAGSDNVAIGYGSMAYYDQEDSTDSGPGANVAIGNASGLYVSGNSNVFIGVASGLGVAASTGGSNTAVGGISMFTYTTGRGNACLGSTSGFFITEGCDNICLGFLSGGSNIAVNDNNICIGHQATVSANDDQIAIGRSTTISGQFGIAIGDNISAATNDCVIGKNGAIITVDFDTDGTWTQSSDIRKKRNIQDDTLGLSFINNLKTKTFQWKPAEEHPEEWCNWEDKCETVINSEDKYNVTIEDTPTGERTYPEINTETVMHGMIAQDVKAALDIEGIDTFGGWQVSECGEQSLGKSMFVFPLIKAVQELSAKVDAMQTQINNLT